MTWLFGQKSWVCSTRPSVNGALWGCLNPTSALWPTILMPGDQWRGQPALPTEQDKERALGIRLA